MSELITAELVDLDLSAETKNDAARSLAERMVAAGRVTDLDGFLADVAAREAQMPTGLDGGIGIPHCRSEHVAAPTLAFGRSGRGIDFGAADGPADLIFLIAAPAGADDAHLTILSGLARRLTNPEFTAALRAERDSAGAAALIRGDRDPASVVVPDAPASDASDTASADVSDTASAVVPDAAPDEPFRIVAVTSCPTGIAHTYMAAEALESAARSEGVELSVETQGSAGFERLEPAVIAAADAVIWAHDVEVREKARFAGKPVVDVGVKAGISRPAELIAEARGKAERGEITALAEGPAPDGGGEGGAGGDRTHFGVRLRTYLMSGVSYMVPFVAAGGLLIALSFAIGGYEIAGAASVADHFVWGEADSWAALLNQIGSAAFGFLVPVLAGYIAYGMADRPALVPGFVGGAIALTIDAGFLGGLVAGLLAGAVVMAIQRVKVHPTLRGIMPVLVIPLLASIVVGFLMFVVVGKPIASLQNALTDWLNGLSGSNAVILGVVLGLMMCFDMGGPLNKVAYAFAVGGLADPTPGSLKVMAAVMAAGMVPPLALALATTVRGRLFTHTERENGRAAWVLGASFITEGAIPFAAADPLRVIPSVMAGGAVTGALSMTFGCTLRAPHGGIFVVPLIGEPFLYLLAVAAGTAVSAALVVVLKGTRRTSREAAAAPGKPEASVAA
ncbi:MULTISPECIES: PTS fructose transporter subunit IIABC [unclassified Streptomyces]|uniref:PTS fructose transporter subunit IIABC n=1 Tax=unclassified Streptomyces TaxID=2593676 RepID=UPI00081B97ED|nr:MULTISPECIES: fructose-specific PTS transporter subunit EIIC [unclassified Streptomyces]MYQ54584.1 PTS transporter subunit EIIA [Streptomyces sp. SID4941]SCE25331.1 PTS system D-fructose-specific IIA component (F1P-forming), Frc family /PTS system D-fructose-specific IIB component (F1P-forming), Frc family /PTS system D-fructose-specific IIC component (F1P-forming), Frc family [Streptomyces sp. PalvLS-984]SDC91320.1 PTS system D-fructose-specific IIA component (F1P-forming), Frc family /PTS s